MTKAAATVCGPARFSESEAQFDPGRRKKSYARGETRVEHGNNGRRAIGSRDEKGKLTCCGHIVELEGAVGVGHRRELVRIEDALRREPACGGTLERQAGLVVDDDAADRPGFLQGQVDLQLLTE